MKNEERFIWCVGLKIIFNLVQNDTKLNSNFDEGLEMTFKEKIRTLLEVHK